MKFAANTDKALWKRIRWAGDQDALQRCRDDFTRAQQHLQTFLLTLLSEARAGPTNAAQTLAQTININVASARLQSSNLRDALLSAGPADTVSPDESTENLSGEASWLRNHLNISRWLRDLSWGPRRREDNQEELDEENRRHSLKLVESRLDQKREKHEISAMVYSHFEEAAKNIGINMDTSSWLRLATWFLLKSRAILRALGQETSSPSRPKKNQPEPLRHGWDDGISISQSCADLLKSSWIVEEIVLSGANRHKDISNIEWRALQNLSASLHKELRTKRGSALFAPLTDEAELLGQNLGFSESFIQPIEEQISIPEALDSLNNPHRWLTPDQINAGDEKETCLLRTFVNAQLGPKHLRIKSQTAPYMFLLWSEDGKSEIHMSLFNQTATVNLTRIVTADDCKLLLTNTPSLEEGTRIEFPSQEAVVHFLSAQEKYAFRNFILQFLEDMKDRSPRPGESLSFRESLVSYELRTLSMSPNSNSVNRLGEARRSCEISLYDSLAEESWKNTRRIVICSSPDVEQRFCISNWLPLSRVQIQSRENDTRVYLIWSDCDQLVKKSEGDYIHHYHYVYKPDRPNRTLDLEFRDSATAQELIHRILQPFDIPLQTPFANRIGDFESRTSHQRVEVHEIFDLDETGKEGYHAVVLVDRRPGTNFVCNVYFVYRDLDFVIEDSQGRAVELSRLFTPHYISNMRDMIHEPDEESSKPELHSVERKDSPSKFVFNEATSRIEFLEHLVGWKLAFCLRVKTIRSTTNMSFFGRKPLEHAYVLLWRSKTPEYETRQILSFRSMQGSWKTAYLPEILPAKSKNESCKVILKNLNLTQGRAIDTYEMKAVGSTLNSKLHTARPSNIKIAFERPEHRHDFLKLIRPTFED